jgi:molybdopterin converting factor subunit 1
MRVRMRFFALLREQLGPGVDRQVASRTTVGALWRALVTERPGLADVPVRFAVNGSYVPASHRLADGDELAVFPPVSGGAG